MSQFTEKNQRFGTIDLAVTLALIGVVVGISQAILGEVCTDHRRLEARMKAESLAFRLAASESLKEAAPPQSEMVPKAPGSRGPASVEDTLATRQGQIGEDPWGHPYRYSMKRDATGKIAEVAVWSDGKTDKAAALQEIRYVYSAPLQSRNRLVPSVSN